MDVRNLIVIVWILGLAGSGFSQVESRTSAAGDSDKFAQLPYHELVKIAQSDSSQPKDKDRLTFVLASRKGVPLEQITLVLQLKKGGLPLPIDDQGHFSVPFSNELMDENPLMVSNQPRGSLSLKFTLAVPEMGKIDPPKVVDGKVKYQAVFQSLVRFQEAMKKVDQRFGEEGAQRLAVQCVTGGAAITIHQKFGSRKLSAGDDGAVWLLYDARLFQENPDISVPEGAEFNLRPVDPEDVEKIKK